MLREIVGFLFLFAKVNSESTEEILYDLDILHHNDFHAHYEETTPQSSTCHPGDSACIGGFPRLYTAVNALRNNNSILLNAGDTFQGTPWYELFKWNLTQQIMNMLPHDAHTIGNHEFDDGIEGLVPYLKALKAPVVAVNINATNEPAMKNLFRKSIVLNKNGRKIGIIGVVLASLPEIANTRNLTFFDEVKSVSEEAERLTADGVDIIIVLSHCGLNIDTEIARRGSPHIDVIVGGHSHSLLYKGVPEYNFEVVDDYPRIVRREHNHKILIVQSMCYCRFLGHLTLKFNQTGDIVEYDGNSIYLDSTFQQDPAVLKMLAPYKNRLNLASDHTIIGYSDVFMDISTCKYAECIIGDFVCQAHSEMHTEVSMNKTTRPICLENVGALRSPLADGPIELNDLKMLHPFGNRIVTFDLQGAHILETLEYSMSVWQPEFNISSYFIQVSGLNVVYNISKPVNQRVVKVEVICQTCTDHKLQPLDPNETYRIVANSFMTNDGDGLTMLSKNLKNLRVHETDLEVLRRYISDSSPIHTTLDGRIKVVR